MAIQSTGNPARLYSQTDHDERGNFEYQGDLQQPGLTLPALISRIQAHLETLVLGGSFSLRGETFAADRKII